MTDGTQGRQDAARAALRLRGGKDALARLLQVPPLTVLAAGATVSEIETIGFDTPRSHLRKAGLQLRVERRGARCVQVLSSLQAGWSDPIRVLREHAVTAMKPRTARLAGLAEYPAKATDEALEPQFRHVVEQRVMALPGTDGGEVAVALESGVLEAGGCQSPCDEVVLSPGPRAAEADSWRVALALHRLEPLVFEPLDPAERARIVASDRPPGWHKAGAVALDEGTSLDDGIGAILRQCFTQWLDNHAAARVGRDIEGVHQMRVALRRMRAALGFLAPWLPPVEARAFDKELKWMARRLGAVRDLDVLLAETLAPVRRARGKDGALRTLERAVGDARAGAHAALVGAMESPRYTAMVLEMGGWIAGHGWRGTQEGAWTAPIGREARARIEAAYRQALDAGGDFTGLDAEARHNLRLDIKRLRYVLQFVGGAFGERAQPWLRLLALLQDGLGAANDAALAEAQLERVVSEGERPAKQQRKLARASGLVVGWWLARAGGREDELRGLWAQFVALQPFWRGDRPQFQALDGGGNKAT